ncbi:hypothetical protein SCHPADRAFT_895888 [Schizopora paradoxa]|uniref:Uncharacterized protein n=1 Tax=Schizopora paradoxa TaxID=27342 RepID=A0A0H2R2E3_9AGAM|nr:hypothetical protein SCHPADRAFT_895888 [Schizopora paradoxa]
MDLQSMNPTSSQLDLENSRPETFLGMAFVFVEVPWLEMHNLEAETAEEKRNERPPLAPEDTAASNIISANHRRASMLQHMLSTRLGSWFDDAAIHEFPASRMPTVIRTCTLPTVHLRSTALESVYPAHSNQGASSASSCPCHPALHRIMTVMKTSTPRQTELILIFLGEKWFWLSLCFTRVRSAGSWTYGSTLAVIYDRL